MKGSSRKAKRKRSRSSLRAITPTGKRAGEDPHEWYERGLALKKVGQHKEAFVQFSRAAQDTSLTFKAMAQVGICLKSAGQPQEAVAAFRKALQAQAGSSSDVIQVRYLLGRTLENLGRTEDTLEQYRWIRREEPGFKDVTERIERLSSGRSSGRHRVAGNDGGSSWMAQLQRILGTSK